MLGIEDDALKTILQYAVAIGMAIGGAVATVIGLRRSHKDDIDRPATKRDLIALAEMSGSADLMRRLAEFENEAKGERGRVYERIERHNKEMMLDFDRFDSRLSEFAKDVTRKYEDLDRRMRECEIAIARSGPRR